jgi:hypothetical protein
MLLCGYSERIDSESGPEWRCPDGLSPCEFLRLSEGERVRNRSLLSRTHSRLPLALHDKRLIMLTVTGGGAPGELHAHDLAYLIGIAMPQWRADRYDPCRHGP